MALGALLWLAGAAALVLLFGALHARYDSTNAVAFARVIFADLLEDTRFSAIIDQGEEVFIDFYLKVRKRRGPLYVLAFAVLASFATLIALLISEFCYRTVHPGPLIWQFATFFGIIASWVAALAVTLWAYQTRKELALLWWSKRFK